MDALVTYQLADGIATIAMDDGKVNVMSLAMQSEINAALDRAIDDGAHWLRQALGVVPGPAPS